jgi:hypothetical protein
VFYHQISGGVDGEELRKRLDGCLVASGSGAP